MVIPSINCTDFECIKKRIALACDIFASLPSDLSAEASAKEEALANDGWVHIDISDGGFTSHVSWNNPEEISNLKSQISNLKMEVHLMVEDPEAQIEAWLRAGAKRIIVHLEAMKDSAHILDTCKKYGAECFLAINPGTEVEKLLPYINVFDGFLTLGVLPGPSGQEMKPETIEKIKYLREHSPKTIIEVDGGVNLETAKLAKEAGATLFVAGAFIFNNVNPAEAFKTLEQAVL